MEIAIREAQAADAAQLIAHVMARPDTPVAAADPRERQADE